MRIPAALLLSLFAAAAAIAEGDPAGGKAKSGPCAGCHEIQGLKSVFPEVYSIPKIANQNPLYIEHALKQYRAGSRSHPSMQSMGKTLSDQDILDLAAYYGNYDEHQ